MCDTWTNTPGIIRTTHSPLNKLAITCPVTHNRVHTDPSTTACMVILQRPTVENLCNKEGNSRESGSLRLHQSLCPDCPQQRGQDTWTSLDRHRNVIDQEHNRVSSQSEMKIQLASTVCFLMKFWAPLSSDQKCWEQRANDSVPRKKKGSLWTRMKRNRLSELEDRRCLRSVCVM